MWLLTLNVYTVQKHVLERIANVLDDLDKHHGRPIRELDELPQIDRDYLTDDSVLYDKLIQKSVRIGLYDLGHPLIINWVATRRGHGQFEILRRLERTHPGLKKGIQRPISQEDVMVRQAATELRGDGVSWRGIHRILKARGFGIPKWSAFHERHVLYLEELERLVSLLI